MTSLTDWTWLLTLQGWFAVGFLTVMEIVLGVDNIVMISILSGRLPRRQRSSARRMGLAVALVTRILLLLSITWVMSLTKPLLEFHGWEPTGRGLILLAGGLFLLANSVREIYERVEKPHEHEGNGDIDPSKAASWLGTVLQIGIVDIVFSLDSVITAVGLVGHVTEMVTAIVIAVAFMMWLANPVSDFIDDHPSVKILALAFLLLIGTLLVAEGFEQPFDRRIVYASMGFSFLIELLNLRRHANLKAHVASIASTQEDVHEALDEPDDDTSGGESDDSDPPGDDHLRAPDRA